MIIFNLICKGCLTKFEGWFDCTKDFEKQKKKKHILCPTCNSSSIKKYLMSPNLSNKSNANKSNAKNLKSKKTVMNNINKYRKIIEKNFDYVGDNFTEEAKKIKYGEIEERPIYGEANLEQTKELIEEEIPFIPLPWTSTKKSN